MLQCDGSGGQTDDDTRGESSFDNTNFGRSDQCNDIKSIDRGLGGSGGHGQGHVYPFSLGSFNRAINFGVSSLLEKIALLPLIIIIKIENMT